MKRITIVSLLAISSLFMAACSDKDPLVEEEKPTIPEEPPYVSPVDTATSVQFLTGSPLLINTHQRAAKPFVQFRITTADSLQKLVLWRVNSGVREQVAEFTTFDNSKDFTKDVTELTPQAYENLDSLLVEVNTSLGVAKATLPVEKYEVDPQLDVQAGFPGAEGFGRGAIGGRGGRVIYVTNLLDDEAEGSLRWACNQTGPRIIMFKVSGNIVLSKRLQIKNDNVTIAGQSAPGDGICLSGYDVTVNANNAIIRYLRFRMGDINNVESDALGARNLNNVMIDHCSMSWSVDECASFYDNENFTLQWSVLSESLRVSKHAKGNHGYGGIWGGRKASFHHNLLAHHDSRNPRFCGSRYSNNRTAELVDFRNNVIYNWGGNSGYAAEGGSYNMVNNYYQPGSGSGRVSQIFAPNADDGTNSQAAGVWGKFYVAGNVMMNINGTVYDVVTNDNWEGMRPNPDSKSKSELKSATEYPKGTIHTHTAQRAYELVLAHVGASYRRDATDARVVHEVRNRLTPVRASGNGGTRAGMIDSQEDVGGWCELASQPAPLDSDSDGMPDAWEIANKLNPGDPSDGIKKDLSTVYTNVEVYLNSLVEHATIGQEQ